MFCLCASRRDGVVGWGEAFSRIEDRALKEMIGDRVLPLVLGRDAKEISRIKHDLQFNAGLV